MVPYFLYFFGCFVFFFFFFFQAEDGIRDLIVTGVQTCALPILAPIIVEELVVSLRKMIEDEGTAAILVEQHIEIALSHTADALVIERGRIVHRAPSAQFAQDAAKLERFVGLRIS